MIKVRAKALGYYGHARRRIGDVFSIDTERKFSEKWMERVLDNAPETPPSPAGPINKDNIPDTPIHTDPNQVRQAIAPSELVPASILNVPARVVIENLRLIGEKGGASVNRNEKLKVLLKAEKKGKNRTTIIEAIDAMIYKPVTDSGGADAPI